MARHGTARRGAARHTPHWRLESHTLQNKNDLKLSEEEWKERLAKRHGGGKGRRDSSGSGKGGGSGSKGGGSGGEGEGEGGVEEEEEAAEEEDTLAKLCVPLTRSAPCASPFTRAPYAESPD